MFVAYEPKSADQLVILLMAVFAQCWSFCTWNKFHLSALDFPKNFDNPPKDVIKVDAVFTVDFKVVEY